MNSKEETVKVYFDEQGDFQVYDETDTKLLFCCNNKDELFDEILKRNVAFRIPQLEKVSDKK